MTHKSLKEIRFFINTFQNNTNDEILSEAFLKLSKTVRARENGSKMTEKKRIALEQNRLKSVSVSGRKMKKTKYTLIGEDASIYEIEIEVFNKDINLLQEIIRIEEENNIKIIESFEC